MGWKQGNVTWWAYDLDLPEDLKRVDVVFTPSARASMLVTQFPTSRIEPIDQIWGGSPIVVSDVEVKMQDIEMIGRRAPTEDEARQYLLNELLPDEKLRQSVVSGSSFEEIEHELEAHEAESGRSTSSRYALACLKIAQNELLKAMELLDAIKDAPELDIQIQRQKRHICARWFRAARENEVDAMYELGCAYYRGGGVAQNLHQAKYWLLKAEQGGHASAAEVYGSIAPLFPNLKRQAADTLASYRKQAENWHAKSEVSYDQWVADHRRASLKVPNIHQEQVDLVVGLTTYQKESPGLGNSVSGTLDGFVGSYGAVVSSDRRERTFSESSRSSRGGGSPDPLPQEKFDQILELLPSLPDDHGILPPPNRQLLVEYENEGRHTHRVYDFAELPDPVLDLMRIIRFGHAYVPAFGPYSMIDVCGFEHNGVMSVSSPNEILYSGGRDRIQWWNAATHEFMAEVTVNYPRIIKISPDGALALVTSADGLVVLDLDERKTLHVFRDRYNPVFSPDGRHVFLSRHKLPMEVRDTRSWEVTGLPSSFPAGTTHYFGARTTDRAVVRHEDGSVVLIKRSEQSDVAKLSDQSDGRLLVEFSPDESLIAVCLWRYVSTFDKKDLVVVFDANSGQRIHVPRHYETGMSREKVDALLWTPEGEYVLVGGDSSISIFNAKSGRHRGEMTGLTQLNGMGLLPELNELAAGDDYGDIHFWKLSDVLSQVKEFEASLKGRSP